LTELRSIIIKKPIATPSTQPYVNTWNEVIGRPPKKPACTKEGIMRGAKHRGYVAKHELALKKKDPLRGC
jgi:hypothetical protein